MAKLKPSGTCRWPWSGNS